MSSRGKSVKEQLSLSSKNISDQWKGGLWMLLGCSLYALLNGLIRYLTGGNNNGEIPSLPFYQIVFIENIIGSVLLFPFIAKNGLNSLKTKMPFYHGFRVLFAALGMILWYASLKHMQIAQAVALSFIGPILGIIGAKWFLQEKLTRLGYLTIGLGFVGSFIIARPDLALITGSGPSMELGLFISLPVLSAAAFAGTKLLGRKLASSGESARLMTFYLLVFMSPISLLPALAVWVNPTMPQLALILVMGILAMLAQLTFARAYALATVSFLTPFGFSKLISSGFIGYLAFAERPKFLSFWPGSFFIILALLLLSYDCKRRHITNP